MIDIKMSGIISKYRNTSGMTLLEIMLSITIIGICIPFIFGILFTNNTIKTKTAYHNDIKNIKNNIISFIKLTSFETIYDVSKTKKAFSYIDNVWLPIILQENKLHYAWFTRNKRLFRGEFVEFIKNKIK